MYCVYPAATDTNSCIDKVEMGILLVHPLGADIICTALTKAFTLLFTRIQGAKRKLCFTKT